MSNQQELNNDLQNRRKRKGRTIESLVKDPETVITYNETNTISEEIKNIEIVVEQEVPSSQPKPSTKSNKKQPKQQISTTTQESSSSEQPAVIEEESTTNDE